MHKILEYDKALFRVLNGKWHSPFFDIVMPYLRNALFWAPLYLFLALLVLINFRKTGWVWSLFLIFTGAISDVISSRLIKENVLRLRPNNDPDLADTIRVLVAYRPQSSSFTSSHAFTHFAMATFLFLTLKEKFGNWTLLLFAWAFFVSYAQVYVGVHFPLDVTCGGLFGIFVGYLLGKLFNKKFGLL